MSSVTGKCRCGRAWTASRLAHCSICHESFSVVSAFDAHRRRGKCLDPADVGLLESEGLWSYPGVITPEG